MNVTDALRRKLLSIGDVSDVTMQPLDELPFVISSYGKGEEVVRDGSISTRCCLLLDGLMHRQKNLSDGGRQILAFHFPGDIPDLQSLHVPHMDHALVATSPCQVAFISHSSITDLVHRNPPLGDLLWRDSLIDAGIFRTWIASMGRQQAFNRMAHLLCEVFVRVAAVGLARGNACGFPVTQEQLADALGISLVHTNRSVQDLRDAGVIGFDGRSLTVEDWPKLQEIGDFDPMYLHLRVRPDFDPDRPIR